MRSLKDQPSDSLFRITTIVAAFLVFGAVALNIVTALMTFNIWGGQRLAWIFSIVNGFKMYYHPACDGPVLPRIYAPLAAFIFYPATFFNTPSQALIFSSLLSFCYFSLPLLCMRGFQGKIDLYHLSILVVFYGFVVHYFSLTYSAFAVHFDCLGLACCALACLWIIQKEYPGIGDLTVAMILAFMAVWLKQVFLPIVLVLPFSLFLWGDKKALRSCLIIIFVLTLLSLVLFFFIDIKGFLFESFIVPSSHPWKHVDKGKAVLYSLARIFDQLLPFILVTALAYCVSGRFQAAAEQGSFRGWFSQNKWFIFVITTGAMIPTSLVSWSKVGGDYNSFSYVQYFLLLGGIYLMADTFAQGRHSSAKGLKVLIFILMICFVFTSIPKIEDMVHKFTQLEYNDHEMAYNYARENPGQAYFPNNPLSVLMAEKKLYHFMWGVKEREMAGYPLTNKQFRDGIPADFDYVIFPKDSQYSYQYILEFLPEYSHPVALPKFPGALVLSREPG